MTNPAAARVPGMGNEARWSPRSILRLFGSGSIAAVLLVFVANLAIAAMPHARGIAFLPALRYAVVTPLVILAAFASAFAYQAMAAGSARPRGLWMVALLLAASLTLLGVAWIGPSGMLRAASPAVLGSALTLAWIIPPLVERPRRARLSFVALALLGAVELFGLSTAPAGFGYTPREQSLMVEAFVERLGLHDVTLVMQDWGGPIGLGFAERRPELVRDLVLGSTWAWRTDPRSPRGRFSAIGGGPLGEFAQVNFNALASFSVRHGVIRTLPSDVVSLYLQPFQPLDRRGIAAFYPGQITAANAYFGELEAGLPRLTHKRALIFWALQDPGFPLEDLTRFEAIFPDHHTLRFPKASHFFFEDTAQDMIPAVRAFLSSRRTDERL